ncbi:MAG: DUF5361 domain-containing protein [Bacilli bacterium]|nr:DUF5361 domain-containing protein [Bacilli bacterium]
MSLDEEAVICDFAEYYHIYDYKQLPLETVAILVYGLRDYSRIKMKISDTRLNVEQTLLATIADSLSFIAWSKTEDARRNQNRPKSILQSLRNKDVQSDCTGFANGADFMAAWKEKVTLCQK